MARGRNYGRGFAFKKTYKDRQGKTKEASTWTISFHKDGREVRESTGETDYAKAIEVLNQRLAGTPGLAQSATGKVTLEFVLGLLEADYVSEGRKSLVSVQQSRFPHLRKYFEKIDMRTVTEQTLLLYRDTRKREGASNASVNRELSCICRAIRLATRRGVLAKTVSAPKLTEKNARRGFFEWEDLQRCLAVMDPWWHELYVTAFITGWRINSELMRLRWDNVDFKRRWLVLHPYTTKNDDGRTFPFTPRLEATLTQQRKKIDNLQVELGSKIDVVFPSRKGNPLTQGYRPLKQSAVKVGLSDRIPHDFRRTAVRNLEIAGVDRHTAMRFVGHRTESIYRRYAIVDVKRVETGRDRLSEFEKGLE